MVFAIALPIGIYGRIVAGWSMPLWFDETFSGTIAGQSDLGGLYLWCRHELTGPGFYAPLWLWARFFGVGDVALRLPSLICSIATPFVVARFGHPDRRLRIVWAIFILLWAPTLVTATEARPYAQLFLFGSLQAITFLRLIREPTTRRAFGWTTTTAWMGLTHYHSLPIGLCEGIAVLAIHRRYVLHCWPALAAFLPLSAWMALHLPFVLAYGQQHSAMYGTLTMAVRPYIPAALNISSPWGMIVVAVIATIALVRRRRRSVVGGSFRPTPEVTLALCGVAAILLELTLGFAHSGFVARYLTPSMPAVLFGCALWARRVERTDPLLVVAVVAAMGIPFAFGLHAALANRTMDERHLFNFEHASNWLAERHTSRLAFLWSDGIGGISGDQQVGEVAGFFLHRAGLPTPVTVVHPTGDPSAALRQAAGVDRNAAILWIANDPASRTRAVPRIAEQDPRWTCRDFGEGLTTLTACHR